MPFILNIDTATEFASVSLQLDKETIGYETNDIQNNHGSFLQPAIKNIFSNAKLDIKNIDAIAVTIGPGSYTGLRVGLASAKGLCYALNKPLMAISTLQVMALASINKKKEEGNAENFWFCPMIDARRMEVFYSIFNHKLISIEEEKALIVDGNSFENLLDNNSIIFSGSGAAKTCTTINHANATLSTIQHTCKDLGVLSLAHFMQNKFANLAYCSPNYLKAFYSIPQKIRL